MYPSAQCYRTLCFPLNVIGEFLHPYKKPKELC